ncbi:MAG: AAA family ATPase [Planctomycetes bacterium]|nr:AAA family ATPase [Planctomycetota bacterium]
MRIAITGKGGVGKTTLAALLARSFADDGKKVLAIDADPVSSLAFAMGFPNPDKIKPLSEMSSLIEERTGAKPGTLGQMFKLNPTVEDLPEKIAHEYNGIKLVVMGGIKAGGSGCVCPESALIKALVRHIILDRDEVVIMDMEAGIEHLGRSTADSVNVMVAVVEPSIKSIQAALKIKQLAKQIGIKNIRAVGNKIRNDSDKELVRKDLEGIKIIGFLPFSLDILSADQSHASNGIQMKDPRLISELKKIRGGLN